MNYLNSPVEKINFNGYPLYIKRDDLLSKEFSGNKARKFKYFLDHDFKGVKKLISYGSAQANSLYSLSVLAKQKNWTFDFYVNHIASFLQQNPQGNYLEALNNGAHIIEKKEPESSLHEYVEQKILPYENEFLFVEEGGRVQEAQYGIQFLAQEIKAWVKEEKLEDIEVMLPSGTGTTALYLQQNLPYTVLTCACVGDEAYLQQQFEHLEPHAKKYPVILPSLKKYHFGKLYPEFYAMHQALKEQTHIEFELLYDPLGFITLMEYLKETPSKHILYIHQGGVLGNVTMIERYARKNNNKNNFYI